MLQLKFAMLLYCLLPYKARPLLGVVGALHVTTATEMKVRVQNDFICQSQTKSLQL